MTASEENSVDFVKVPKNAMFTFTPPQSSRLHWFLAGALLKIFSHFVAFMFQPRGTRGKVLLNSATYGGLKDTERRRPTLVSI